MFTPMVSDRGTTTGTSVATNFRESLEIGTHNENPCEPWPDEVERRP